MHLAENIFSIPVFKTKSQPLSFMVLNNTRKKLSCLPEEGKPNCSLFLYLNQLYSFSRICLIKAEQLEEIEDVLHFIHAFFDSTLLTKLMGSQTKLLLQIYESMD